MATPMTSRPTADRPLLVGLLVDVSGSMTTSINNVSGRSTTRLDSLRDSLDDLIARAAKLCQEGTGGEVSPRVRLFAYGFGFGNPLSYLLGDSGSSVRDLLDLGDGPQSALGIDTLAREWQKYRQHIGGLVVKMLGDTPMARAFRIVADRVRSECADWQYTPPPILFVVSDGEPTDEPASTVRELAQDLKRTGTTIVSCLLTAQDVIEPRRLYGSAQPHWPEGARLMFDCASALPANSPFDAYFRENRWVVDAAGRLFTQINQSEVLREFSKAVLSPLASSESGSSHPGYTVRVFVTYSHQDSDLRN